MIQLKIIVKIFVKSFRFIYIVVIVAHGSGLSGHDGIRNKDNIIFFAN